MEESYFLSVSPGTKDRRDLDERQDAIYPLDFHSELEICSISLPERMEVLCSTWATYLS